MSTLVRGLGVKQSKMSLVVGRTGDPGYITDGIDDHVQINAAALAVYTAGGGVVELPDRSYVLGGNNYIQLYDGVWYRGGGMWRTSIGVVSGYNETIFGDYRYYDFNTWDGVSRLTDCIVSDLKIDGTNQVGASVFAKGIVAFHTTRLRVQNVWCYNTTATGIGPDFNIDCLIDNCIAEKCGKGDLNPGYNGFGLGTGDTDESVLMVNCMAIDGYNGGFLFERQDDTDEFYPREYQLTNCYAIRNRTGFRNSGCSNMILTNCIARDSEERGFYHERYTNLVVPQDITMMGCVAYDNGTSGIEFTADTRCRDATLIGCRSYGNGAHGIVATGTNLYLEGNKCWGNKNTGIKIAPDRNRSTGGTDIALLGYSDLTPLQSIKLIGNNCWNNGINNVNGETEGIRMSFGSISLESGLLMGNSCYDNQATATQGYGILVSGDAPNLTLDHNEVFGNGLNGIHYSINAFTVANIQITYNTAYNNSRNGVSSPHQRGIHINGDVSQSGFISHVLLQGNRAYDDQVSKTQEYGISLSGNVANVQAINNDVLGNNTAGFYYNPAAADNTNQFHNNKGWNPEETYSQGNVTGATTFNRLNGNVITATLTGSITVTLTAGVSPGDRLLLVLTQDGTGSRIVTWPSNFKKAGGTLTLSTPAGSVDIIEMEHDGTNWREVSRAMALS